MASKNWFAKSKKMPESYAVVESGGWSWHILKLYKSLENSRKDPYARAFCLVKSPIVPDGEYGDVYLKEIPFAYSALLAAEKALPEKAAS
jgi:hypothetical protein